MRKMVLSVLVDNTSGALNRIAGLFSRRGYNIDSLTVGETENPNLSRMTIVVRGDEEILEQIFKQISKFLLNPRFLLGDCDCSWGKIKIIHQINAIQLIL